MGKVTGLITWNYSPLDIFYGHPAIGIRYISIKINIEIIGIDKCQI